MDSKIAIEKHNDIVLYSGEANDSITIINTHIKWYRRLWYVVSNPFYYVITGKLRY